jgi:exosome complex RNA-binding protein Rrp4
MTFKRAQEMANQKPDDEVRIGTVKAATWPNDVASKTHYSVTISRIYRDAEGQRKTTQSLGRNDLLVFAKVADQAHSQIFDLKQGEETAEQEDEPP